MKKRIISLLLAFSIVLALVPAISTNVQATAPKITTSTELVDRAIDIAKNYKTLYVRGGYGHPLTSSNKTTLLNRWPWNRENQKAKINAASSDTFAFDCVCLIKGIMWGWDGDSSHSTGGAKIDLARMPDVNTSNICDILLDLSSNLSPSAILPGEVLWMPGHVGIYIGDGKVVEATSAWDNKVQITNLSGTKSQKWQKHGKLPNITYCECKYNSAGKCTTTGGCGKYYNWDASLDTSKAGIYQMNDAHYIRTGGPYDAATYASSKTKKGAEITVLGTVKNHYGNTWYKLSNGYIYSTWAKKVRDLPSNISVSITWPSEGQIIPKAAHNLEGTITSSVNIKSASVYVDDKCYGTDYPNAKTFSLKRSKMDIGLPFNALSSGKHTMKIVVTDVNGGSKTATRVFYTETKPAESNISASITWPSEGQIIPKKAHNLEGTITSAVNIKSASVYVDGKCYGTDYPNAKSFSLKKSKMDIGLPFNALSTGKHTMELTVTDTNGTTKTFTRVFYTEKKPNEDPGKPNINNIQSSYAPGTIVFNWSNTANTTHYNIWVEKKNSSGKYEELSHTFYVKSGWSVNLTSGEYRVMLQSTNSNAWTDDGSTWRYTNGDYQYFTVKNPSIKLSAPTVKATTDASTGAIKLSWNKVANATSYYIYRYNETKGAYYYYDKTTGTSYTNTKTTPGVTYYYKVKAVTTKAGYESSALSAKAYVTRDCSKPVIKLSTIPSSGAIKLQWNSVSGASKYYIYRSTSKNGPYNYYDYTTKTSYTNTKATPGVTYYYKVKAICGKSSYGNSALSSYNYITRDCAKPVLKATNIASTGKIKLSWNAVSGASRYYIYRSTSPNGTYKYYTSTTKTQYTEGSTTPGKVYYYKVKAICGKSSYGNSAASAYASRARDCAQPVVTIGRSSSGKPKLTWKKVDGASKYYIYRYDSSSGSYEYYYSTTGTSFTNTSAKKGYTYYYKVKAICGKSSYGNSALSAKKSIKAK